MNFIQKIKIRLAHRKALRYNRAFDRLAEIERIENFQERMDAGWKIVRFNYGLRAFEREINDQRDRKQRLELKEKWDKLIEDFPELEEKLAYIKPAGS